MKKKGYFGRGTNAARKHAPKVSTAECQSPSHSCRAVLQDQSEPEHPRAVSDHEQNIRRDLEEIGRTRMPFGKFGPTHYPPQGIPICDLPLEYLSWFATKGGFPKGRLGELLRMVHQMKVEGLDAVFDPIRKQHGGRTVLRTPNRRSFEF